MKELIVKFVRHFNVVKKFFVKLPGSARVLDLGCGTGNNGVALKALHPTIELHGVDILSAGKVPSFYCYKTVDLENGTLPYPDDYFDAIVFTHVIEHLRSPLQLGKEINRVMKKQATIYVETPNWTTVFVPSFGFHRDQHNPFNFYDDPTHIRPWSKHGLFEFLFQSCSLRVTNVGTRRNWLKVPFDFSVILFGILTGKRSYIVSSFWNLYGWCIYGIGVKD